jgi:DNA-binding SARP family transcriptional activator
MDRLSKRGKSMTDIKVSLFGKFNINYGERTEYKIKARKVQELLVYLLIFRNHPQPRESLCELLWADLPAAKSRKYLRQTLWHIQSVFAQFKNQSGLEFSIDNDWVQLNLPAGFWLDTIEFEKTFDLINQKQIRQLSEEDFQAMQSTSALYRGDFLEGWYQDWCIFERERFQSMYLMLLDKLVQYCEIHRNYEVGLKYAWQILRFDQAYERAHRQMMRLYFLSGNRTQALHQYDRCVAALEGELGVEPSEQTKLLYAQIRSDTFKPSDYAMQIPITGYDKTNQTHHDVLERIEQFAVILRNIDAQIHQELAALENVLSDRG